MPTGFAPIDPGEPYAIKFRSMFPLTGALTALIVVKLTHS